MTDSPSSEPPLLAAAQASLEAVRAARTSGPGPEPEALRGAYLGLLKLCLCDLGGSSTVSVGSGEDGLVWSRDLRGDEVRLRAAGMDWPLQGLTMVGLTRLDDLQRCVESVHSEGVPGDMIEAGAWRGGASILMRATLDSLGAEDRTVVVADSFEGFMPPGDAGDGRVDLSPLEYLSVPVEEVRANFSRFGLEDGVEFVEGFFQATLPTLADRRWSLIRLDGDTYDATRAGLENLYPALSVGGYLVSDDYGTFDECRRAVDDYRSEHGIEEPLERVDYTCVRWRRESEAPIPWPAPAARHASANGRREGGSPPPRTEVHVPSIRELELLREVAELRDRLGAQTGGLRGRLRRLLGRAAR